MEILFLPVFLSLLISYFKFIILTLLLSLFLPFLSCFHGICYQHFYSQLISALWILLEVLERTFLSFFSLLYQSAWPLHPEVGPPLFCCPCWNKNLVPFSTELWSYMDGSGGCSWEVSSRLYTWVDNLCCTPVPLFFLLVFIKLAYISWVDSVSLPIFLGFLATICTPL